MPVSKMEGQCRTTVQYEFVRHFRKFAPQTSLRSRENFQMRQKFLHARHQKVQASKNEHYQFIEPFAARAVNHDTWKLCSPNLASGPAWGSDAAHGGGSPYAEFQAVAIAVELKSACPRWQVYPRMVLIAMKRFGGNS
jgi:hypothetical protein